MDPDPIEAVRKCERFDHPVQLRKADEMADLVLKWDEKFFDGDEEQNLKNYEAMMNAIRAYKKSRR